jgi:hypothetical protein
MYKASVIIVEDNFIVMMELKERLVEMGYEIADTAKKNISTIIDVNDNINVFAESETGKGSAFIFTLPKKCNKNKIS